MQELIKIEIKKFQDEKINSVNARELWKSLGVNKKFTDWIIYQIKRGMFDKNIDFITSSQKCEIANGGYKMVNEYYLTLDTAKEIAMMSGTTKGKEVRNYFIQVEKEFFKMRETLNTQSNINKVYVTLSDSKVREAFFIAFDGKCYYSNEPLNRTHFHIDHILPKSKGGEDILSNLVLCKPNINQIKSDSYNEHFVNHHQNIVNKNYAPRVEAILNLLEDNKILDLKYLFNSGVMNKLEDLYGRETIKELYANLIPNLNYKKSQKIENKTTEYFIKNCIISTKGSRLSTINLYENYLNFCEDNQISEYSKIRFFQLFRDLKNMPKTSNLRVGYFNGKRQRYFKNLEVVF